ncbi:hypothetical protein [Mangrovicoccus algicola]|uniref:Uncharacterized protein n=1 Tax=Mangrovicoccus algicola TaxID=2771008 RepID=A0A8J7CVH3_9RHOB|nr:hypothetical protein [Mangrovicoccus algicola]MBE3638729.1 hypothetical protein [Mangrovicoccus algicola]
MTDRFATGPEAAPRGIAGQIGARLRLPARVKMGLGLAIGLAMMAAEAFSAQGLPEFDGTSGYAVIGPYEGGLLVQDRRGLAFLCDSDIANIVLLKNCRPVLSAAQVEGFAAAEAEQARQKKMLAERNRVLALPEAEFETAGRAVLSAQGCQVDLSRAAALRNHVLPDFAGRLGIPADLQPGLMQLTDDLFTQTLERLLRKRQIGFDRATRIARLVECEQ